MQNRFGIKDFVLLVLVLGVGVLTWLGMKQADRGWLQNQALDRKLTEIQQAASGQFGPVDARLSAIERRLQAIDTRLETGAAAAPLSSRSGMNPGRESSTAVSNATSAAAGRDESWARPGAPVKWFSNDLFTTDPRPLPGYHEGGEFVEMLEAKPNKIVPLIAEDVYARRVSDVVCEYLGDYNPRTLKMEGILAEAWQYDPSGLWLRAKINPRARFSDGKPVTAEDVRWTFDQFISNAQMQTEAVRSTLTMISKVSVIAELVVEFTFSEAMFSNENVALAGFYILPKHFYSRFTPTQLNQFTGILVGSGPYRMQSDDPDTQWTPGKDIVLVRNENYWRSKPPLARMRFKSIEDELARLTAFRNGEGDMFMPSSPQYAKVSAEPGWDKEAHSLNWVNMKSAYAFIAWQCGPRNGKLTPFADRRVRTAMTMMLDRQKMIRDVWGGVGIPITGPQNPEVLGYNTEVQPVPFDVLGARALLKQAGWEDRDGDGVIEDKDGKPFVFEFTLAAGGEVIKRCAAFVKDSCAAAGIDCRINFVDWAKYDELLKGRDFDAITLSWQPGSPESDPNQIWHSRSIDSQGNNFIQWRNAEADRLIDAGRREMDQAERIKLWKRLHATIAEDQPYTFIRAIPWLRFVKKDFQNVNMYPKSLEPVEFFRAAQLAPMN